MPCFLDNIGLGMWERDKEGFKDLITYVANHGEGIRGYYDVPYMNYHFGHVQMIARTRKDNNNHLHITGLDTHCRGRSIWKLRIADVLDKGELDPLYKKLLLKGVNGKGLFPAHIVNADVLPSFKKEETIVLQMIAFSEEFHCYRTEEEYELTRPLGRNGQKLIHRKDTIYPSGYFSSDNNRKDEIYIHGTLLGRFNGDLEVNGKSEHYFLKCPVRTQFGCLEIAVHSSKLTKETILNMDPGAIIECKAILAGDAAIYNYEKGINKDPEHNLKLLAYTLENGDPERLRPVLKEETIWQSDTLTKPIIGAETIIAYLHSMKEQGVNCNTEYATINTTTSIGDMSYPAGTKCFIIQYANQKLTPGIVFIDYDQNNNIKRITIKPAEEYQYTTEPKPPREINFAEAFTAISYKDNMLRRAKHYGLFPADLQLHQVEEFIEPRIQKLNKLTGTLQVRFTEKTFANAFMRGLQSDRTKKYDKSEMEAIGAQFERDYVFLTRDEDQRKLLREAVNFTAALGCLFKEKQAVKQETEPEPIILFLPMDKRLWYDYLTQTILYAYTTGNFEPMIGFLADNFQHGSLWVSETLNHKAAIPYYLGKGNAIQKSGKYPTGKIFKIQNTGEESSLGVLLKQESDDGSIIDILAIPTLEQNLISRLYITDPKLYNIEE